MVIFLKLFPCLLITFTIYLYFQSSAKKISKSTGFKTYPLVGILPELLKNHHRFLDWTTEVLTDCPRNTAILRCSRKAKDVMTANPLLVEYMAKTNFDNYPKGHQFTSHLVDLFGKSGLFTSDGKMWKMQRKTTSHEFNTNTFKNFFLENVVLEIEKRLLPVLGAAAVSKSCPVLDLQDIFQRLGFDISFKMAFNVDLACLGGTHHESTVAGDEVIMTAYQDATKLSTNRFISPLWKVKKFLNLGSEKRLRESITTVHEFVDKIIRSRINKGGRGGGDDFLSRLMISANGIINSPEFLRDMTLAFILAAKDTMSTALTWLFWLVSSRPEIQHKILMELESIRIRYHKNIGEYSYSYEQLREMHYIHATITETMRLYPPVPIESRACLNDDVLPDGTVVGKNSTVTYNAYAMGRMESIWGKNCYEFRPERWLQDGVFRQESPYRYPIFHAGPRICLGKDIAYIQMKSIVAAVIDRFEIKVQKEGTCPEHMLSSLMLTFKGGLPVTIVERK
ncbi:cytochrome P450 CYP94D108-like [Humulus lupulus]|uniref:cytochrome P450 CYP94D108-like n=1 Tax=Humulus lupulus TaxID=3486 RepID=UPI002B40617E|nr:cytochrome P450 CYP94D108-like [Humulus lupulus]